MEVGTDSFASVMPFPGDNGPISSVDAMAQHWKGSSWRTRPDWMCSASASITGKSFKIQRLLLSRLPRHSFANTADLLDATKMRR